MAEFVSNAVQSVAVGSNVLFTDTVVKPCCAVKHRAGSGIFTLTGGNKYTLWFSANVTGATAGAEVTIALAIGGEEVPGTRMASTPDTAGAYNNVATGVVIEVPCGCCYTVSVRNIGTIPVNVATANLIIVKG